MNLAEFPLAVLSTRVSSNLKTLEFVDSRRLKTGELVERKWIITGADKFGLPTSTDDDVVLGLIHLTMRNHFRERKVYFTRYELLKILRWSTEGRSYRRLNKSLDRLSGVRIRASNSFYDNSSKSYLTRNFGIIDEYEIKGKCKHSCADERDSRSSYFVWSDVIFNSFKAGFIKKLDLDIYFSLERAVSRRLYRYLDKHFYYKSTLERPLMTLAFEKIGVSRNYKYASSVKQQLEPAAEELVKIGFLAKYEFSGSGRNSVVSFVRGNRGLGQQSGDSQSETLQLRSVDTTGLDSKRILLIESLISRGISASQARRLIVSKTDAECIRLDEIIDYYDHLVETRDSKVSRNRVGFLYRAMETPDKFSVPPRFAKAASSSHSSVGSDTATRRVRPEHKIFRARRKEPRKRSPSSCPSDGPSRKLYREFLDEEIKRGASSLDAEEIARIYAEVEHKISCLRSVLSSRKFDEASRSCVRDEIARRLNLPDYEAWCRLRSVSQREKAGKGANARG